MTLLGLVVVSGCGARTDVVAPTEPPADASAAPGCVPVWGTCEAASEPVSLGRSQHPSVAWSGTHSLVAHQTAGVGVRLMAVSEDGAVLWDDLITDERSAEHTSIAYNAVTETGLVGSDTGVQWLGDDGRPVGGYRSTEALGDVGVANPFPTSSGFLLTFGGDGAAHGDAAQGLLVAGLGAEAGRIEAERIAPDGSRGSPAAALDDNGLTTSVVSRAVWGDGRTDVLRLDVGGRVAEAVTVIESEPADRPLHMFGPVGIAQRAATVWVVVVEGRHIDETHPTHVVRIDADGTLTDVPVPWLLDPAISRLGDAFFIAHDYPDGAVRVSPFDPECPARLGPALQLDERTSHSAHLARTPGGFVAVWSALSDSGLETMVQYLECREP